VVVVDDRSRFPLHVWRYVSRSLGFGAGDVDADGTRRGEGDGGERWLEKGAPLDSEDANVRVWWVGADARWPTMLAAVLANVGPADGVLALIDVHGERGSGYDFERVCEALAEDQRRRNPPYRLDAHVVSAYYPGVRVPVDGPPVPVLPKSRETLHALTLPLLQPPGKDPDHGTRHILVTGAGFEVRGKLGGFGLPPTNELLGQMGAPFYLDDPPPPGERRPIRLKSGLPEKEDDPLPFPVPDDSQWGTRDQHRIITARAARRDLDGYWDCLLEAEQLTTVGSIMPDDQEEREDEKAAALQRERSIRESFRRAILQHDWGHMNQSLTAAGLPWHAWLTTNFTHFANRAVDLANRRGARWRIIATETEARILLREDVTRFGHGPHRWLFKLHGDIAHLQTMAIAGYDKDVFSPLGMPMENLNEVYNAAQRFLIYSLRGKWPSEGSPAAATGGDLDVVWHIVGHGLLDRNLRRLLLRCADILGIERQAFVLVNRVPTEPDRQLRSSLKKDLRRRGDLTAAQIDSTIAKLRVHPVVMDANTYMARLHHLRLPACAGPDDLATWLTRVNPPPAKATP
jgi:hypothetical protein